ncbi:hypothetical protein V2J09_020656 [Rumex salicifolius]
MELKLFDSVSLSGSNLFGISTSNPCRIRDSSSSFEGKSYPQFYSCKVALSRASNSGVGKASISSKNAHSYLSWITGINGGNSSNLFSRRTKFLDASDDEYDGVVINPQSLPSDPVIFASQLNASLSHWRMKGKKGVWLKLPLELSELVPIAVKEGFGYHHAEPGYVMLTYWIPDGPCMLPANASHQVGIGAFVINEKNEVLVVQEKYCPPAFDGFWKIPTGFIVESEEIYTGAVREVKEETGIDTEFVEVLAFRHAQNMAFEKSDLFFICILKPLSTHIKVDDQEIKAAQWMPFQEFVAQSQVQEDSMFRKVIDVFIARVGKLHTCGLYPHEHMSKFDGGSSTLYHIDVEDQGLNCHAS